MDERRNERQQGQQQTHFVALVELRLRARRANLVTLRGQIEHITDRGERDGGALDVADRFQQLDRVLVYARVELHDHDKLGCRQQALAHDPYGADLF